MVAEPWLLKMRKKKKPTPAPAAGNGATTATIGILSFEVANAMSRAIHLHRSLSDAEISRLRSQTLASPSIQNLVSPNEPYLLSLALAEKLDDLNRVAAVAARLGRRCSHPALLGFEHVYSDLLAARIDPATLGFLSKDIDASIRKMEKFVAATATLYTELEVLSDLENSARKFAPTNPVHDETRRAFDQKIQWQRQDIRQLRDSSLWNQPYDKVVLLLARAVCTIHSRIRVVFGEAVLGLENLNSDESRQLSGPVVAHRHVPLNSGMLRSGPIQRVGLVADSGGRENLRLHCGASPGRLFLECLSLGSSTSDEDHSETESSMTPFSGEQLKIGGNKIKRSGFGPKGRLTMLAPPSTVGGSALALHYANVIIIIEKLLRYPHLVGEEARDDLYQMLPSSLRSALRKSLKSYVKNLAIYDAPLAHDWKVALEKVLSWLAPMAHNMIRWQTERNFEQQQIVLRENVLLLQTLYFADREKTEAAICELLVGLNYICRYEQQQNALLDCTSSLDFDECMDWQQMQY